MIFDQSAECHEGHASVLFSPGIDCPVCKESSKRLTEVNALEVKLALLEQKVTELMGTIDSLAARFEHAGFHIK